MACDNAGWMQGIDAVEGREPLFPRIRVTLGKVEVRVVVHAVARNDEIDRGNVKTGRIYRIGVTKLYDQKPLTFQRQFVAV